MEGHGEAEAVRILIDRIALALVPTTYMKVGSPLRVPRDKLVRRPGELERYVRLAANQGGPDGRILILFDADDDCPRSLATNLLARATEARSDRRIQVVIAKREYEAWFLAAAESIAASKRVEGPISRPDDPEAIRDAKGRLSAILGKPHAYQPVRDQAALTAVFDLEEARRYSPSFDKMCRAIGALLV
ncbi:DUF4276 family protein [Candidatus Palauibacter sp.]|uniref:DUF4276 family protein n=1 Tax=Candidatus Palauibacter sp. TaxID=3101350 RepID=UPI003AF24178